MTPAEADAANERRRRAQAVSEFLEARRLWIACVQIEDRRGESFAMRKLNATLDAWNKPPRPTPPRPSHL